MSNSISFPIISFIIAILITIVFLCKEKVDNIDTRLYKYLLITNVLGLFIEISAAIMTAYFPNLNILNYFLLKLIIVYYATWIFEFYIYIRNIGIELKDKNTQKSIRNSNNKIIIIYIIVVLISLLLRIELNYEDGILKNTYGPGVTFVYILAGIIIFVSIATMFKNIGKNTYKKFVPLIVFLIFGSVVSIIQYFNPAIILISSVETFVTLIMYNTIENPDIKLVEYEQKEKEKIIAAAESKSEFLSSTSHELRTPLNAIIGLSEDIQSFEDMNPEIIDDTKDLINASNALLDVISNILDSSKIESGKLDVVECDYDSRKEYEALGNIYRIKAFKNKLQFNMNISDNVPKVLYGDKQRIKQIISNLLDNAIKFTDVGKVNFNIDWNNQYNILIISVVDTGNGLSDEEIKKFLSDTEELKIEKVYSTKGSGLGLSITKNLIKILGGRAKIDSKKMVGTKFVINIPQKLGSEKAIEESEAANNISVNNLDFSGKRLLVVDDNVINIKVLRKAIKTFNFEVDECYNGKDAIDKIELNNNYDLVLMDIMMPVMGGEEAIGLLRQKSNFTTPVIALTADAVSGAKEKYTMMGFNDYLSKPFSRETVAKKISLVLGNGVK